MVACTGIPELKRLSELAGGLPLPVSASLDDINTELQATLGYRVRYCLKSTKHKYAN